MGICLIKRAGVPFKAWLKVVGPDSGTAILKGPKGEQSAEFDSTKVVTFLVKKKGTYTIDTSYKTTSSNTIDITKRKNTYTKIMNKSIPTVTLSSSSITIYGGTGSGTVNLTVKGIDTDATKLSALLIKSSDETACIGALKLNSTSSDGTMNYTATITYKNPTYSDVTTNVDYATISIISPNNDYYQASIKTISVTLKRTELNVPTLSSKSIACTGSKVGPIVSGFNSSLMTQSGTTSTNTLGTYTITWTLRDTNKYCWKKSDGSLAITNLSDSWTCSAGTITIYVRDEYWKDNQSYVYGQGGDKYTFAVKFVYAGTSWSNYSSSSIHIGSFNWHHSGTSWWSGLYMNINSGYIYGDNSNCHSSSIRSVRGTGPTNGATYAAETIYD